MCCRESGAGRSTAFTDARRACTCIYLCLYHEYSHVFSLDPCTMSHDLLLTILHVSAGHETSTLCCTAACAFTASSVMGFITSPCPCTAPVPSYSAPSILFVIKPLHIIHRPFSIPPQARNTVLFAVNNSCRRIQLLCRGQGCRCRIPDID